LGGRAQFKKRGGGDTKTMGQKAGKKINVKEEKILETGGK